jgi:TRAP-type mannitol/chloroaromatic compound transport system permease small subunit
MSDTGPKPDMGDEPDVTSTAEEILEAALERRKEVEPVDVPGGLLGILYRIKEGIEAVTTFTGNISLWLVWVVFVLGLFNVITRYAGRFVRRDIIIGEVFDLQWMVFGALFLLGFNYGVREGVNPRIDFWWANFSLKTKAWIDLVFHTLLFLPFLFTSIVILWSYSMTALGQSFDGSWEQSTDAGGLPRGPIKFLLLLGFILMATQVIAEIIKQILVLRGREDLAELATSDIPLRVE